MTIMRRPSPFGELLSLRQAMDSLFEDSFVRPRRLIGSALDGGLPLDVKSTADALIVEASLPGFTPEEVDITVEGGRLTITGRTSAEERHEDGEYFIQEIRRGSFRRAISLPEGLEADKATANFENGLLKLRIPRAEQVKPRQIRISPAGGDGQPGNGRFARPEGDSKV